MGAGGKRRGRVLQRAFGAILFAGFGLCVPASGGAEEFIDETRPVDVMSGGELPEDEARGPLAISEDGRYITFNPAPGNHTGDDYRSRPMALDLASVPARHGYQRGGAGRRQPAGHVAQNRRAVGGRCRPAATMSSSRSAGSELGPGRAGRDLRPRHDHEELEENRQPHRHGTDGRIISAVGARSTSPATGPR